MAGAAGKMCCTKPPTLGSAPVSGVDSAISDAAVTATVRLANGAAVVQDTGGKSARCVAQSAGFADSWQLLPGRSSLCHFVCNCCVFPHAGCAVVTHYMVTLRDVSTNTDAFSIETPTTPSVRASCGRVISAMPSIRELLRQCCTRCSLQAPIAFTEGVTAVLGGGVLPAGGLCGRTFAVRFAAKNGAGYSASWTSANTYQMPDCQPEPLACTAPCAGGPPTLLSMRTAGGTYAYTDQSLAADARAGLVRECEVLLLTGPRARTGGSPSVCLGQAVSNSGALVWVPLYECDGQATTAVHVSDATCAPPPDNKFRVRSVGIAGGLSLAIRLDHRATRGPACAGQARLPSSLTSPCAPTPNTAASPTSPCWPSSSWWLARR